MRRSEYHGADGIAPLCDVASLAWCETSSLHPGDIWWSASPHHGTVDEWLIAVWSRGDRPLAAAWLEDPESASVIAAPDAEERERLLDEVVDWASIQGGAELGKEVLTTDEALADAWRRAGFVRDDAESAWHERWTHELTHMPETAPPPGYVVRPVGDTEGELEARVRSHVEAWSSAERTSRFDRDAYDFLRSSPFYRPELDWVAETPDGDLVANALVWWDERTMTGLLEPVGSAPSARGRGVGRAVVVAALDALRALGGKEAIVWPRGDPGYQGPARLYTSCGFRAGARNHTYRRPTGL